MRATIDQGALVSLLKNAAACAGEKGLVACVRLEAARGKLLAQTTDCVSTFEGARPCAVETEGCATVRAQHVADVAAALHAGPVAVQKEATVLRLTTGKRTFSIPLWMDETAKPRHASVAPVPVKADGLRTALRRGGAASGAPGSGKDSVRLGLRGHELGAESIDGHRLALSRREALLDDVQEVRVWAPESWVRRVLSRIPADTEAVRVALDPERVTAVLGDDHWTVMVREPAVAFDDIASLARTPTGTVTVARAELLDAVHAARALGADGVIAALDAGEGQLVVTASGEEGTTEVVVAAVVHGTPLHRWSLATDYLADALAALDCERVEIGTTADNAPISLRDPGDDASVVAIMPRRIP